jgi:hypothetical protein
MDLSSAGAFLNKFETGRVLEFLQNMRVGELIHNPWFLGLTGFLAVMALVMRWRLLLAFIVAIAGFAGLTAQVLERGAEIQTLTSESLLIFAGGGVLIIFVFLYLVFIKGD